MKTCIIEMCNDLPAESSEWLFKSPLAVGILWWPHYRPHSLLYQTSVVHKLCACACVVFDVDSCRIKSDTMSTSFVFLEGDNTVFTELTYLGSATVDAPRSETEINRNMKVLNTQSQMAIPVTLSVPAHSEGVVRLVAFL